MDQPLPHDPATVSRRDGTAPPRPNPRSAPWWRQLVVTVVVLVAAIYAVAYLVPGAAGLLGRYGIALPLGPSTEASTTEAAGTPNAGAPNPGGNPGSQRGRGRETAVVVTAAVTSAVINDKLMAIGEGSAARSVTLTSAAGGTLTELKVKPGDKVEAGTVIAELDFDSRADRL